MKNNSHLLYNKLNRLFREQIKQLKKGVNELESRSKESTERITRRDKGVEK